jgi:hypothetical protein
LAPIWDCQVGYGRTLGIPDILTTSNTIIHTTRIKLIETTSTTQIEEKIQG